MHDTKIEDQLRDILRAEADGIPFTLTAPGLELRLRLRGTQRANRRMLLGAAAALVITVGAGAAVLLSNRANNQSVATSPSPSAFIVAPSVVPSAQPTPGATAQIGFDQPPSGTSLVEAAQAEHPGFVLATSGEWNGSEGTVSRGSAGDVPITDEYVVGVACLGQGSFEYSIGPKNFERRHAGGSSGPCDPTAAITTVAGVDLQTDVPLSVETYGDPHASWRVVVLVRESALPAPPMSHQPTAACEAPGQDLPKVTLSVNGGAAEAGDYGTTGWKGSYSDSAGHTIPSHVIHAKPGDDLRIRIGGDICADHWTITYAVDVTEPGEPGAIEPVLFFVPNQENGNQDLAFASENRFSSTAVEGDWIVHASLGFPDGGAEMYWHLIVEP
jgi:hypothetical protein